MGCQSLESIPDFVLLSSRNRDHESGTKHLLAKTRVIIYIRPVYLCTAPCTSSGRSPCSLNLRGILLRAYLQPLKYMLHEHPKENEAPHFSGSLP